ncbi:MAG TPA: hypothetical protein VMT15_09420 [Bryobacteraceae bacterium]|nr:hypothetical protein [Bryobacteraceae bacterium]
MRPLTVITLAILLAACDSKPVASEAPKAAPAAAPKPSDESRRFPKDDQIGSVVVDKELLGKPFMPGGTLVKYRKGKAGYDMFAAKMANPAEAALILPDWRKALTDPKLVPSFGAYYGLDAGRPVFVFSKGPWIAGIAGLSQKDADAAARKLAAALD